MGILSARFVVLACLGAVLPIAPPVDAAHLYGSVSVEKQQTHNPSTFGGSTATHRHDDGHRMQDDEIRSLPPWRRYRIHDHKMVHDHDHDKVVRSAFARSRYRRGPDSHTRRSSVYVPGEHGNTYIVTRTPSGTRGHEHAGTDRPSFHDYDRRQVDENNLAMGRIDIMGASQPSGSSQRLASLAVDSAPIDWSSGQSIAKAFSLNASTTNQTQFIMVPTGDSAAGGTKHVTLATQVFDPTSAEMVMYCATYNADPGTASPLLMTPCTGTAQSVSAITDAAADPCETNVSSSNPNQRQVFSYDPSSGKIEPIAIESASTNTSTPCAEQKVRRATTDASTTSGSAKPSSTTSTSTSTSTAPAASASQPAQNVTLVYVTSALEVPAAAAAAAAAAVFTTTITTTVMATVTPDAPAQSGAPARAAVSTTSTTVSASTASTTTTSSSLSLSSGTASASTTPTPALANAAESLEVEIVGVTPSTTAGPSSTSAVTTSTTTATTTNSYSSGSASPTLNAAAVASSLASLMARQRRGGGFAVV